MTREEREKHQIISYITLRIFIGFLGIGLPVIVAAGDMILNCYFGFQNSISDYHHTVMQDVFSGTLFVLGFFLFAYKGYEPIDDIIADFGGMFALGTALFPNDSEYCWLGNLHFVSATLLFVVFVVFSMYLFRKKGPKNDEDVMSYTPEKRRRRRIYFWCGIVMIVFLLCIAASFRFMPTCIRNEYNIVFWFETLALWAFGISWITKAQVLAWLNKEKTEQIKQENLE